MRRTLVAVTLVSVVVASLGAGASGGTSGTDGRAVTEATRKIVLRGRLPARGPWRNYLLLKLVKSDVVTFTVCAFWNQGPPSATCRVTPGNRLPTGTMLRLEQRPIGAAIKRPDSPGWGMVALSPEAVLEAVLSNTVSGNKFGTFSYRVTLRNRAGRVLATSNTFKAFWQR